MAIVHWFPIQEIENLQREIDHMFGTLSPTSSNGNDRAGNSQTIDRVAFVPAVEIAETSDMVYLNIEIPGMDSKDLEVQVTAESVEISGERKTEAPVEEIKARSEFRYGKFRRVVPMPARIQNDKVEAEYKNGVLSLKLPKVDAEKNKVVKISLS